MRYQIKVKVGRKTVRKFQTNDYSEAMDVMTEYEHEADFDEVVEFHDTLPFSR